jgi:hypothetical protein
VGPLGDSRRRAALRTHPGSPISMLTAGACCLIRPRGAASARVNFPALRRPEPGGERIRCRSSLPLSTSPRHPALFGERRRQQRSLLSGKRLSDNHAARICYRISSRRTRSRPHHTHDGHLAGAVGSAILVGIAAAVAVLPTSLRALSTPFALSRYSAARPPTTLPPTRLDESFCVNLITPQSF